MHEAFCFDSFQDRLLFFDDFEGDQVKDEWRSTGSVGGSAAVIDQQTGGIVRITTDTDQNDSWYIDWNNIRSLLVSKRARLEVRLKLNSTSNVIVAIQLRFDGNNTIDLAYNAIANPNWTFSGVDGGASSYLDSGVAADTSYHIFRIECHIHGGNHFHVYIDGSEVNNSPSSANIPDDATDYLQPFIYIKTQENAAKSIDVDYTYVREDR